MNNDNAINELKTAARIAAHTLRLAASNPSNPQENREAYQDAANALGQALENLNKSACSCGSSDGYHSRDCDALKVTK